MTEIHFEGRWITIGGQSVEMPFDILDAFTLGERVIVLGDPDSELRDPDYADRRAAGLPSKRNLIALSLAGELLWEAEYPEHIDCYFRVTSREPLEAYSFSCYRCRIDEATGRIVDKVFHK